MALKNTDLTSAIAVVAMVAKPVAAPKTAAHLATNEELLDRLRVYGNNKENQFKLCIDNVTTPFMVIKNPTDDSYGNVGSSEGFDGKDEADKEAVRAHYVSVLATDPMAMAQGRLALEARFARLQAEKAQKAAQAVDKQTFKAEHDVAAA
jgi:hypothetical protein